MYQTHKLKNTTGKVDYEINDIQKINIDKMEEELNFEVFEGE